VDAEEKASIREPGDLASERRQWLRWCVLPSGLLLLGLLWVVAEKQLAERALENARADLAAAGEALSYEEFARRLPVIDPVGLNEYTNLLLSVGDLPLWSRRHWCSPAGRRFVLSQVTGWPANVRTGWVDDVWNVIPGAVEANRDLLRRAAELATNDLVLIGPLGNSNVIETVFPCLSGYLSLMTASWLTTLNDLREGRPESAMEAQLQGLRLFQSARKEPSIVFFQLRNSMTAVLAEGAWELLQHRGWSEAQLARLQGEWEGLDLIPFAANALRLARLDHMKWWSDARADPSQLHIYTTGGGGPLALGLWRKIEKWITRKGSFSEVLESARALWWPNVPAGYDAAFYLRMSQTNILAMEAASRARSPAPLHGAFADNMPPGLLFTKWMGPSLRAIKTSVQRAEAIRALVVTAIAIERYRIRHGSLPRTLKDLTPDYLKTEPIDWFDGRPLRYRADTNDQFILYSVGQDLKDDGGAVGKPLLPWWPDRDLVWPMPATAAETDAVRQELLKARRIGL